MQKFYQEKERLPKWKKERIKSCMTNLVQYLEELFKELDKEKIEEHCKLADKLGRKYTPFISDMILLMINSYQGAIETDLHWITDLTIGDSIDISIGGFDFSKLEKYIPKRISEINSLLDTLLSNAIVSPHVDSIQESIQCFNNKHIKASNLLLITTIEGLVRAQGIYLNTIQKLSVDMSDKRKYASLDSFLNKIPWKKDLPISIIRYGLITGNSSMNHKLKDNPVFLNLHERLGFLCRRFKENRNNILHGENTNYANSLNCFLNFSALKETLMTIREYEELYTNKTAANKSV